MNHSTLWQDKATPAEIREVAELDDRIATIDAHRARLLQRRHQVTNRARQRVPENEKKKHRNHKNL